MKSLRKNLVYFAVFLMGIALTIVSCHTEIELSILNSNPSVSPDGQWILFNFYAKSRNSDDHTPSGIYIMNANGKGKNLLLPLEFVRGSPENVICWSQDGRHFATTKGIYTIENNMITGFKSRNNDVDFIYDLSPNGKIILCGSFDSKIFLCDIFFDNMRELPFRAQNPRWMPDGKHIVSSMPSTLWYGNEICITDTLGTDTARLIYSGGGVVVPIPSPDGTMIAFSSGYSVFVMNSDGTNQIELDSGESPAWTPDSKYIVYSKYRRNLKRNHEISNIWKISIDGKEKIQLTNN